MFGVPILVSPFTTGSELIFSLSNLSRIDVFWCVVLAFTSANGDIFLFLHAFVALSKKTDLRTQLICPLIISMHTKRSRAPTRPVSLVPTRIAEFGAGGKVSHTLATVGLRRIAWVRESVRPSVTAIGSAWPFL